MLALLKWPDVVSDHVFASGGILYAVFKTLPSGYWEEALGATMGAVMDLRLVWVGYMLVQ